MDRGSRVSSVTRAGNVTRASSVTWGWQRHLGLAAPPRLAVPLLSAEGPAALSPMGAVPGTHSPAAPPQPAALQRPTAVPRGRVTTGPVTLTPTTHPVGAPGFHSTSGLGVHSPPSSWGAPRAGLPVCVPTVLSASLAWPRLEAPGWLLPADKWAAPWAAPATPARCHGARHYLGRWIGASSGPTGGQRSRGRPRWQLTLRCPRAPRSYQSCMPPAIDCDTIYSIFNRGKIGGR